MSGTLHYVGGMGFVFFFLFVPGVAAGTLLTKGKDHDLATVLGIPLSIAILAAGAVVRLLVWESAGRVVIPIVFVVLILAAATWKPKILIEGLTNLKFVLPIFLVFGFVAAYVTLPLDPPLVTPYPRTFFANPVKILGADDHLQYRTAQFVFNRADLEKDNFYYQWRLTDRTPLAGLAFAEFAQTIGNTLPAAPLYGLSAELQEWKVPDPYSYWLYRLFLMLGNASVVGAIGYFALKRFGKRASNIALAVTVVMPFTLLQVMMTYPKMLVAAYVVIAVALLFDDDGSAWLSGLLAGLAYLTHPMAFIYFPALGLILVAKKRGIRRTAIRGVAWSIPLLVVVGAWHAWVLGTGTAANRTLLYPLGAYTESEDPAEVERVKQLALRRIEAHPVHTILGVRAVSLGATFLSIPDFRCRGLPERELLYCLTTWPLPGALGFGFVIFAYAGLGLAVWKFPAHWLPIAVTVPLVTVASWGIDGRALVPEFLHPFWAIIIPVGAWLLTKIKSWVGLTIVALSVVQGVAIALLSFNFPFTFDDDGIGKFGYVMFFAFTTACVAYAACRVLFNNGAGKRTSPVSSQAA